MRLRYLPVLFIPAFTFLAIYVGGEKSADSFDANREMIVLRKIGHEILLNAGDSHSRVLPVTRISDQQFRISFENPLSLMPDSVVKIVGRITKENNLPEYAVTVTDCSKNENVYGFSISHLTAKQNVVPCLGRELPKDCYYISLLLPAKKNNLSSLYYIGAALTVSALLFFLLRNRFKRKPLSHTSPVETGKKQNVVAIGNYSFYPDQQYLELNGERTTLTNKEARLLFILSAAPNTVIERSLLQKEVWENEGVIVTRSLDMFISKLRKKLSGDTAIKIVNVHSKGYKLEIA